MKIKFFNGRINVDFKIYEKDREAIRKVHEKAMELVDKTVRVLEPIIKIEREDKWDRLLKRLN